MYFNSFLLLVPVFIWNYVFYNRLPSKYSSDIESQYEIYEQIFRILVLALPLLMKVRLKSHWQKEGLIIYIFGISVYFISWIAQIYFPDSLWSNSQVGLLAPAYTPIIWILGIGMSGSFYFSNSAYFRLMYMLVGLVFVFFHVMHMATVLGIN